MRLYFDSNATTPLRPEAREALVHSYDHVWANASSVHTDGRLARETVERARHRVAKAVGCSSDELVFTSGATEANNAALVGAGLAGAASGKKHLVTAQSEHPSVVGPIERLVSEHGFRCTWLSPNHQGQITVEQVLGSLEEDTGVVALMGANNETGNIYPVYDLGPELTARGVHFHVDCVQLLGKAEVNLKRMEASSAVFSAHKIYGPKGIGALYVKKGLRIPPFMVGGHQEREKRAGTEAVPLIASFGVAAQLAAEEFLDYQTRIAPLREQLWQGIQNQISGVHRNGVVSAEQSLPNTLNLSFDDTEGETILISLDLMGVSLSSGSACTAGSLEPSHVLLAMGLPKSRARAAIRFSLTKDCTEGDIQRVVDLLPQIVRDVRQADPATPSQL
jgi:cysteine desulfurase